MGRADLKEIDERWPTRQSRFPWFRALWQEWTQRMDSPGSLWGTAYCLHETDSLSSRTGTKGAHVHFWRMRCTARPASFTVMIIQAIRQRDGTRKRG